MKNILLPPALLLALGAAPLCAITYEFETPQDLADNFTLLTAQPSLVAPGQGVGGGTALSWQASGENFSFAYEGTSKVGVGVGAPATVSLDFRIPFSLNSSIGAAFNIGFQSPSTGNPLTRISAGFSTNSGTTLMSVGLANTASLGLDAVFLDTAQLDTQNWMRLELAYGLSVGLFGEAGPYYQFEYDYSLYDLGVDGLQEPSLIATDGGVLDYFSVFVDFRNDITVPAEWSPYFSVVNFTGLNPIYADNLSVVPEPSATVMLVGGLAAGFAMTRRRRRGGK